MKTIKFRLFNSISANGIGQILNLITQISMVPIFIKSWNINLYGEWIILNVLSALLALLDFGYINAATNRMTFELAYGNIRNTAEVFRSMIYIINIISLALVMLIILYILNPISIFLDFKYISQSDLKIIIIWQLIVIKQQQCVLMVK